MLEAGSYVIGVSVNDTKGNTQTGSFRLTVRELPPPPGFPMELVIGGIGVGVIILVLVIWKSRK